MARHSRGRRHSRKMGGRRHSRKHVSRKHSRKMGGRRHSRKHASRKSRRHMKRGGQQAHQQQTAFCLTPVAFNAPSAAPAASATPAAPAGQTGGRFWLPAGATFDQNPPPVMIEQKSENLTP